MLAMFLPPRVIGKVKALRERFASLLFKRKI